MTMDRLAGGITQKEAGLLTWRDLLKWRKIKSLTAEEAKEYGYDLSPGWSVRFEYGENGDEPKDIYVSPEKWEYRDIAFGETGEPEDYIAYSPEGEQYTKQQLVELEAEPPIIEPVEEREFITDIQFDLLKKSLAEGTLAEMGITQPLWLSTLKARELGYGIGEGEYLRIEPKGVGEEPLIRRVTPEGYTEQVPFGAPRMEIPVSEALQVVYPERFEAGETPEAIYEDIRTQAVENQQEFLRDLVSKGRTPEVEAILNTLYEVEPGDIDRVFEGLLELRDEELTYKEYLRTGGELDVNAWRTAGTPLRPEGEREVTPIETGWGAAWNKLRTGASQFWFQTKDYFFTILPNAIFIDPIDALPEGRWEVIQRERPEYAQQLLIQRQNNRDMRDKFREIGVENREQYEEWVKSHPELKPPPEWEGEILTLLKDDPTLILDPAFIAYIAADSASFMAAFWGATIAVGVPTRNPIAGMAAGVAVTTPAQSQDLYQDLLWAGAKEQQAAQLAVPVGLLISSVEMIGGLALLKAVGAMPGMRPFYQLLRRNVQRGVAKSIITEMAKRGVVSFAEIELAEIFEEIIQQAIQDALVKTFDESREILGGITETVLRTFISVLPLGLIGGGTNVAQTYRRMSPDQRGQVEADQASLEDAGLPPEQAEMIAFTNFAETPEGQSIIEYSMGEVVTPPEVAPPVERVTPTPKAPPTPITEPVVTPPVTPEVARIEATLPEGVRGLTPTELIETRTEMGTLAGYTDDISFRSFLGKDTKYWNEATYRKAKAGQSFKVYRAVPTSITEIHSGAWVTQSREYAQMHLESVLRGEGHIVEGTAKASDLIAMAENEFFYAPEPAIPKAEVTPPAEVRAEVIKYREPEGGDILKTGQPVSMTFIRNLEKAPDMGERFAQHLEPKGEYMNYYSRDLGEAPSGFEVGEITFNNPLVLEHKTTTVGGWKSDLSEMFGGRTGRVLTNAIKKAGYDGIITTEVERVGGKTITAEIVNLSGIKAEVTPPVAPEVVEAPPVEIPEVDVEVRRQLGELTKMHDYWRNKLATSEQTKASLAKFVRESLPPNVRGRYITAVARVKTDAQLEAQMAKVSEFAELNAQKVLKTEVRKEIKKAQAKVKEHILKGKFTPDVQRRLDTLTHNLELDRDMARDKMAENIQKYDSGELNYEEMLEANESLNFAGIDGMSAEELANTLEYIKILETVGRSERQAKQEAATERINTIRTDVSSILTGGQGLKTGIGAVPRGELAAKPGWIDTFVNWQYSLDNLADKLSKLDPVSKPYQSQISKFVAQAHRATARQAIGTKETYNKITDAVREVYGVKSTFDINQTLNGLGEEVNLGVFELTGEYKANHPKATTVTIKMTRDEMIAKYMQMQDYTLNDTFTTGMGWSQEVRDAVENNLTAEEKQLADSIFGFYEDYYTSVNEIYQELYNVDMPHNPKYSPIRRDFEGDITENVLTFQDASQFASVLNGSLKARQRNVRPLRFNGATQTLSHHIDQMEHFKAWATTMRDFRRVFGNKEIRQAIEQYHGRGIGKLIDTFMNQMARGGIETATTNRIADYLRRSFTKSILAIKPVVGLKQIPSLFGYISEMNTTDFFGGIANFWKSPIKNFKFLYDNSEGYRARVSQGFERDIRATMEKHGVNKLSGRGSFTDWFLLQIRFGDTMAVTQGMWAKYQVGLKQGLPQAEAIAAAEDTTGRTQPSFGIDTLSAIQNGGSWLKLMTMFQNQPNKYFRMEADNLRNFKYGRGSRAKAASTILLVHCVLPMMFQFIADAFQWKPERQLRAGLLGSLNYILIGGQLVQSAWGWVTDQTFDWQVSPVLSTIDEVQKAFMKAKKMVDRGLDPYKDISGDDVADMIEYLAKIGGQLLGLPTPYLVQVEKGIRGKLAEGEDIDIKDFLFSQWALEPPKKGAEEKVEDASLKLGELKEGQEDKPLTEKELKLYTTVDWFNEIGNAYSKVLPQDVFDNPKVSKESKAWAESEIAWGKADILPNITLYKINTEDNDDTIINYYEQWKARERIDNLPDLIEFDKLYPKANLGNVTRQQYDLLKKYLEAEDKDAFLEVHDGLKINPRNAWLKDPANARGAALLALRGKAKILSLEVYNEFKSLIKSLDIPEDAIPELTLPPETSIETHFTYEEFVSEGKHGSGEAKLLILKDFLAAQEAEVESYAEWHDLKVSDESVEYLQLRVDNQELYDKMDAIKEDETLSDTEREEAYAEVRATKVGDETFRDIERRVDAMGKGTREAPIPQDVVDAYVEHYQIVDETSGLSAEAKLNRYENPDLDDFLMNEDYHGKQKAEPLDEDKEYLDNYLVPRWRIDVKYRTEDAEYEAISEDDREARDTYLLEHDDYRMDRRRREALEMSNSVTGARFPLEQVENFVSYWEIPVKGKRQERFLVDNSGFAEAMHNIAGIDIPLPQDVPSVEYDDIYDQHSVGFDELEGLGDHESEYYIEDILDRKARREALRFDEGKYTEFGLAEIRRDAYGKFVLEERVNDYVGYYTIIGEGKPENYKEINLTDEWYKDDWFLMENTEFYEEIYKGLLGNQKRDFSKVPTREVFTKYLEYLTKAEGKDREDYRWDNLDLDDWLLLSGKTSISITEKKRRAAYTPGERLAVTIAEMERRLREHP